MTMKLEKFKDKSKSIRKILLISLGVIVLISLSLLLYKTFASFNEHVVFPMMNGKVDYFGNSDVYFAFYKGDEQLEEMPQKGNEENLVFDHAVCDNGASIEWNENEWAPLVKELNKVKTKCSLYFDEYIPTFDEEVVKCGQGKTAATTCITDNASLDGSLIKDDYGNLRYTGANPNNYVTFNSETWRIIGIIDGKLKIIRNTYINFREWDDSYNNNWASSEIASYLNNEYAVRNNSMVVSGNWNVGGAEDKYSYSYTAKQFYYYEQETKWTGTVGLITVSDYGYAVGGSVREICLGDTIDNYYTGSCAENDWLTPNDESWTITAVGKGSRVFILSDTGYLGSGYAEEDREAIYPVVYLNETTRITGGTGEEGSPFILE